MQRRHFLSSAALAGTASAAATTIGKAPDGPKPAPAEAAAIEACARDYIEGWYQGDAARMESALHPELAKRRVRAGPRGGGELAQMGALQLLQLTRARSGQPEPGRRAELRVLDVFGHSASVRIDAQDWVDYLHLARVDGRWCIVNVLWELRA